jgi:hypothetical protein
MWTWEQSSAYLWEGRIWADTYFGYTKSETADFQVEDSGVLENPDGVRHWSHQVGQCIRCPGQCSAQKPRSQMEPEAQRIRCRKWFQE